jgi:5-methylcytosine-specific restriction endonuclease McrA
MRNLLALEGPALDWYDRIVAAKHLERRKLLSDLRTSVSQRYEAYLRSVPRLEALSRGTFTSEQAEALRHCYEVETAPLNELKTAIKERQDRDARALCAYCGIDSPETFEHYVPRVDFPEYAVCAHNLLPACFTCNTLKGERWMGKNGRRLLHFYYDRIPEGVQWLFARIVFDGGLPEAKFSLLQPAGIDPVLYQLIVEHYEALHLFERYESRAAELISEMRSQAASLELAPDQLGRMLAGQALHLARFRGRNHWKVAAWLGMADSAEFLEWVSRTEHAQARSA